MLPLVGAVLAAGGAAWAAARADATGVQSVSTASFGAQASLTATAGQPGGLAVVYTGTDNASRTFFVRNTGTLRVTASTWSLTLVDDGTGGTKGTGSLYVCSGSYTGQLCVGTETRVATAQQGAPGSGTATVAVPVGGAVSARFAPGTSRGFTAVVDVTVSRSQASPAGRTSSA